MAGAAPSSGERATLLIASDSTPRTAAHGPLRPVESTSGLQWPRTVSRGQKRSQAFHLIHNPYSHLYLTGIGINFYLYLYLYLRQVSDSLSDSLCDTVSHGYSTQSDPPAHAPMASFTGQAGLSAIRLAANPDGLLVVLCETAAATEVECVE